METYVQNISLVNMCVIYMPVMYYMCEVLLRRQNFAYNETLKQLKFHTCP